MCARAYVAKVAFPLCNYLAFHAHALPYNAYKSGACGGDVRLRERTRVAAPAVLSRSALAREVATRAVHGSTALHAVRESTSLSLYLYRRVSLSLTLRLRSSVEMSRRARPRRGRPLRRLDDSLTSADCRATVGETGESWGGGPSAGLRQEVRHDEASHWQCNTTPTLHKLVGQGLGGHGHPKCG